MSRAATTEPGHLVTRPLPTSSRETHNQSSKPTPPTPPPTLMPHATSPFTVRTAPRHSTSIAKQCYSAAPIIMRYAHETRSTRPSPLHRHYSYRDSTSGPRKATMHARASGIKEGQEIEMTLMEARRGSREAEGGKRSKAAAGSEARQQLSRGKGAGSGKNLSRQVVCLFYHLPHSEGSAPYGRCPVPGGGTLPYPGPSGPLGRVPPPSSLRSKL